MKRETFPKTPVHGNERENERGTANPFDKWGCTVACVYIAPNALAALGRVWDGRHFHDGEVSEYGTL